VPIQSFLLNYMQPEPIETSTELSNSPLVEQSSNTSQHGFQPLDLQLVRSANEQNAELAQPWSSETASRTSPSDDVQNPLERLDSASPREDYPKPVVQRIIEHENASSPRPRKKPVEGPLFRVVRKASNKADGLRLEDFPNGK
jgi:hypothetical protein